MCQAFYGLRGRFWVYKGLNGDVFFDWQLTREHHHFADWIGDAYEGVIWKGYQPAQRFNALICSGSPQSQTRIANP